jgi:hypothetical protein
MGTVHVLAGPSREHPRSRAVSLFKRVIPILASIKDPGMFFGGFQCWKRRIQRNPAVSFIQDHAMRVFRAFETAATNLTARASFLRAGFLHRKNKNGSYVLEFDEAHVRGSPGFRKVRDLNFPLQSLTPSRQHS